MSVLWSASEAAKATGGRATGAWAVTGLSIDSRSVAHGEMFIALTDQRDGHDFVADALNRGAAAAMVSRIPDGVPQSAPLLVVPDVLQGLRDLAVAGRARTAARVIAVTGSVGKTTTKEMLRTILSFQGKVHAAERSFNNHWGVPLTLARCPVDADFAVVEIGMNHPGEIEPLSRLTRPDVAVVTTVAVAHLEAFENVEGIAREKAAIFAGLSSGGAAVLNGDLETSGLVHEEAARHVTRVLAFGEGEDCDARLGIADLRADGSTAQAVIDGHKIAFDIAAPGRHLVLNALAAITASGEVGADLARASASMSHWTPFTGRGTLERLPLGNTGVFDLLDDSYNANPTSVGAALEVLSVRVPEPGGRRVAILGDMLELGDDATTLHAGLASHPAIRSLDLVHCVGPLSRALWQSLPEERRGQAFDNVDAMVPILGELIRPGDLVLVKGSLGSRLGIAVAALRDLERISPPPSQGMT